MRLCLTALFVLFSLFWVSAGARAEYLPPTYTMTGATGLMTVPDARVERPGTVRAGVSVLDPYWHSTFGAQLAGPLWVGVRQSTLADNIWDDARGFYPGLDVKWQVLEEGRHRPAVAIGMQSAVGHRRLAGEYIVASKRIGDFDTTLGLGWGRFAQSGVMGNPLRLLGGHFKDSRPQGYDGQAAARAADWFTGQEVGLLAGVAWHTPVKGLVAKLDTSGDRFEVENASIPDFKDRDPWAFGLEYTPPRARWLTLAAGTQGGEVFSGRVTLTGDPAGWPVRSFRPEPYAGEKEPVRLRDIRIRKPEVKATMDLDPWRPAPFQLNRAARHMADLAEPGVRSFRITPMIMNFRGPSVRLPRRQVEQLAAGAISPEELWHAATIEREAPKAFKVKDIKRWLKVPDKQEDAAWYADNLRSLRLILDAQGSLSEFDHGLPYRISVVAQGRMHEVKTGTTGGLALRLNVADNLSSALGGRPYVYNPSRGDVAAFADNVVSLDEAWLAYTHTVRPGVYLAVTGGYLEEMYAGVGAEGLWRPYGSRFALGAEAWYLGKRAPESTLALKLRDTNTSIVSGHANLYYDMPEPWDATLKLRLGRYLGSDWGGSLAVEKRFDNGVRMEAFATITQEQDLGPYGEKLGAYAGLRAHVPLGGLPHAPAGSEVKLTAAPLGRNFGQALDKPVDIYELTRPLTLNQMARQWPTVME